EQREIFPTVKGRTPAENPPPKRSLDGAPSRVEVLAKSAGPPTRKLYSNSSTTISGFDPRRRGGPQVPAPLEVKTCILPIRLKPYTNCRYIRRAIQLQGMNWPRWV